MEDTTELAVSVTEMVLSGRALQMAIYTSVGHVEGTGDITEPVEYVTGQELSLLNHLGSSAELVEVMDGITEPAVIAVAMEASMSEM